MCKEEKQIQTQRTQNVSSCCTAPGCCCTYQCQRCPLLCSLRRYFYSVFSQRRRRNKRLLMNGDRLPFFDCCSLDYYEHDNAVKPSSFLLKNKGAFAGLLSGDEENVSSESKFLVRQGIPEPFTNKIIRSKKVDNEFHN